MVHNELRWQTKIVETVKASGAYAQKTAHRTKVGVPDLLIKLPELPAAYIEVKHEVLYPGTKIVNVEVTKLQALHCKTFTRAGGCAFWLLVCTIQGDRDTVMVLASNDMEDLKWNRERLINEAYQMGHRRGLPWTKAFLPWLAATVGKMAT